MNDTSLINLLDQTKTMHSGVFLFIPIAFAIYHYHIKTETVSKTHAVYFEKLPKPPV